MATATAFVGMFDQKLALITNRHVVTGRHQETNQVLHPTGAVPDTFTVFHNAEGAQLEWAPTTLPLIDEQGASLWQEHPALGSAVDVVALPLPDLEGVAVYPFLPQHPGTELSHSIGGFLSIVGFPFGRIGGGPATWIKGALASEPSMDYNGLPAFLVDSRTRVGQSGSPVLLYQHSGAASFPDHTLRELAHPVEFFLGIYSGRIHAESDLGIVWRRQVVADLLAALPPSSHDLSSWTIEPHH